MAARSACGRRAQARFDQEGGGVNDLEGGWVMLVRLTLAGRRQRAISQVNGGLQLTLVTLAQLRGGDQRFTRMGERIFQPGCRRPLW
ncbi:MAG: hypothetical protein ACR2OE_07900 [Thermomicrobiales bacterium]